MFFVICSYKTRSIRFHRFSSVVPHGMAASQSYLTLRLRKSNYQTATQGDELVCVLTPTAVQQLAKRMIDTVLHARADIFAKRTTFEIFQEARNYLTDLQPECTLDMKTDVLQLSHASMQASPKFVFRAPYVAELVEFSLETNQVQPTMWPPLQFGTLRLAPDLALFMVAGTCQNTPGDLRAALETIASAMTAGARTGGAQTVDARAINAKAANAKAADAGETKTDAQPVVM